MTLSDKVYEKVKQEIIACALKPGDQIAQAELVRRYRTGMMPVREALQRLTQEGYLQVIPRFGYVVKPISLSEVRDIYEVRFIVEPEAARLAALRASPEQLDQIAKAADLAYTRKDRASELAYLAHNRDFHLLIAICSGNQRLIDLISRLLDERIRLFHLGLDMIHVEPEKHAGHIALARALCARDADRASELTKEAVAAAQDRVMTKLLGQTGSKLLISPNSNDSITSETKRIRRSIGKQTSLERVTAR